MGEKSGEERKGKRVASRGRWREREKERKREEMGLQREGDVYLEKQLVLSEEKNDADRNTAIKWEF